MNKLEFIEKLDSLNLDKNRYCVIAGGMMLLRGLRKETADIDIKIRPDYFDELKTRFDFKKSPKYPYLYNISDDIEVAVLDYDDDDTEIVDGRRTESPEMLLKWMLKHNRPKDQEKIRILQSFIDSKKSV